MTTEHPPFRPSSEVVEQIRAVAKKCGWAIGEHGSKARDIDLIAAPWVQGALPFETVIACILSECDLLPIGSFTPTMPHHRKCQLFMQPGATWELGAAEKGQWTPQAIDLSFIASNEPPGP